MKHVLPFALILGIWSLAASLQADNKETAGHPDPKAAAAAGGVPKAEDFLKVDPAQPKTAFLTVISAFNDANYGMNFNGFAKGRAKYVVPQGWTVKVHFENKSPVPHSLVLVEKATVRRLQMGDPVCQGASTPNPVKGTTGKPVDFEFTAPEAGDYALACGFPSHAANGHWLVFEVSATATAPSLQLGDAPAYTAK